ncbi:hypothetical protein KFL_002270170 [Klebsormidium nitens]|uniref:Uncharacterized protein n=1 Tax=Klebsormidium nitens TaxID=105231 RepID=A0A1Y1I464_KLENI|nr:hypothetical protein KFL_002270170 [Klebsormidium nitens]|eukprot:GAQ85283.1 hypothetical protein KFL_002270170 [Klebsormidium nitens]
MQTISQQLVYSAELLDAANQPLPKIQHQGTTYIIGHPGEVFRIRARVRFRNSSSLARPNKPQFKVFAKVDGQSVGYTKLCYVADNISGVEEGASESVCFRGKAHGDHHKSLFTFAVPETRHRNEPGTRVLPFADSEMGTIVVRFREGLVLEAEDVKHFMKPSLRAGEGELTRSKGPKASATQKAAVRRKYETVDLFCRFETADVLRLREILNLDNPSHKAIYESAQAKFRLQKTVPEAGPMYAPTTPSQNYRHLGNGASLSGVAAASTSLGPPERRNLFAGRLDSQRGVHGAELSDPLPGDNLEVVSAPGNEVQRGREFVGGQLMGTDTIENGIAADHDVASDGLPGVNGLGRGGSLGRSAHEAPVHTTLEPVQSGTGLLSFVQMPDQTTGAASEGHRIPALAPRFENGNHPSSGADRECQTSRGDAEYDDYAALASGPVVNRTRGALAAACREGRAPLSLSSLKKRAAEREGIFTEKRKRPTGPREKVTIDLTAQLGEGPEEDGAYIATVERLPAAAVVPLD